MSNENENENIAPPKWRDDPVREMLKKDIIDKTIPPEMKPSVARGLRPEYKKNDVTTVLLPLIWYAKVNGKSTKGKERKME